MPITSVPNLLTLSRILVIPVAIATFYVPGDYARWFACALFSAAGVTDWLDGHMARRWQQQSEIGRFLDPVADKLLVSATLLKSSRARNSVLSPSANCRFAGTFLTARRTGVLPPSLSPFSADDSPAGILTRVSHTGHFTAFPRAVSGAFSTFSHFGQRTLTAIMTF